MSRTSAALLLSFFLLIGPATISFAQSTAKKQLESLCSKASENALSTSGVPTSLTDFLTCARTLNNSKVENDSQVKPSPKSTQFTSIEPLITLLGKAMLSNQLSWEASTVGLPNSIVTQQEARANLQTELYVKPRNDPISPDVLSLAKRCIKQIDSLLAQADRFHNEDFSTVLFFNMSGLSIGHPIGFATFQGKLCILLSAGVETVFNALGLGDIERASEVISTMVIPMTKEFEPLMQDPSLTYFAISVTYGQRNFAESGSDPQPESVCFVWSKDDYAQYKRGDISRQKFMRDSAVFMRLHLKSVERIELK